MDPVSKLDAISKRMPYFVASGTASGFVTLVARHGHIASLSAIGDQHHREAKPVTCAGMMVLLEEAAWR